MESRAAVQLQAANQAANDSRCSLTSSGTKIDMHNSKVGPIENSPESAVSDGAALVPRDRGAAARYAIGGCDAEGGRDPGGRGGGGLPRWRRRRRGEREELAGVRGGAVAGRRTRGEELAGES